MTRTLAGFIFHHTKPEIMLVRPTTFLAMLLPLLFLACRQEPAPPQAEQEEAASLLNIPDNVISQEEVIFSFPELPSIQRDQPMVSVPDTSLATLDSIRTFLEANPGLEILITGYYDASERVPGGYEDLGLARADHLAGILRERGVPSGRIAVSSVMEDLAFDEDGMLRDGYRLRFMQRPEAARGEMDRTVYFWAAEDLIRYDSGLHEYIGKVKQHLEANPTTRLVMTGHTDYNGNHLLGEMRAEALRDYFGLYGVDPGRVVIRSEGPDKPVAENDTQENKAKNRRVEITFE